MTIFYRSVIKELHSHTSVVFSTLVIIWVGVLMVRLLGEAAGGGIGADAVYGMVVFSTVNALPVILAVSTFVGVLTAVTRTYRESEMVVWFASGKSLVGWMVPVASYAFMSLILVAICTLWLAPYTRLEVNNYRERYEQRSDISRIAPSQFWESGKDDRVFYAENVNATTGVIQNIFIRALDRTTQRYQLITAKNAHIEHKNLDRFLILEEGQRYDFTPGNLQLDFMSFDKYGMRLEDKDALTEKGQQRISRSQPYKIRSTMNLLMDESPKSHAELVWRLGLPLLTLNLALLAIPLGAVNPRLGKSGDLVLATVVALLYLNVLGLMQSWVGNETLSFFTGASILHVCVFVGVLLWIQWKMRVR